MRWLIVTLLLIFTGLQYQLWFGSNGVIQTIKVQRRIDNQLAINNKIRAQNHQYRTYIEHLNSGLQAIETMARRDLGLIKSGEDYYHIVADNTKQE